MGNFRGNLAGDVDMGGSIATGHFQFNSIRRFMHLKIGEVVYSGKQAPARQRMRRAGARLWISVRRTSKRP